MPRIADPSQLEAWIAGKPIEWARTIAARAALRVLPLVGAEHPESLLQLLRASFLAQVVATYPQLATSLAASVQAALLAAAGEPDLHAEVDAVGAVISAARGASDGSYSLDEAVMAAASAGNYGQEDLWAQVAWDAQRLEDKNPPAELAESKLWMGSGTGGLVVARREFYAQLRSLGEDWSIWLAWYDSVLRGQPAFGLKPKQARKIAERIADRDDAWWRRRPAAVNADIREWIEGTKVRERRGPSFGLLMHGRDDAWGPSGTDVPRGRILEHTHDEIRARFRKPHTDATIASIALLPTLIAYEEPVGKAARVGRVVDVHKSPTDLRLWVEFDEHWEPIPASKLQGLYSALGFEHLEQYRTHWAVKNVDLFAVLQREGYEARESGSGDTSPGERRTISGFILDLLDRENREMSIDEIDAAFRPPRSTCCRSQCVGR